MVTKRFRYIVKRLGRARHSVRAVRKAVCGPRRARSDAPYQVAKFICHSTRRAPAAHHDSVNAIAPATAIAPPASERAVGRSPSKTSAKGMTTIGVIAMIASTTPVGVVSKAHCMQLTPKVWPARLFIKTHGHTASHFFFAASTVGPRGAL